MKSSATELDAVRLAEARGRSFWAAALVSSALVLASVPDEALPRSKDIRPAAVCPRRNLLPAL
ncbi:hypothetical protein KEU06_22550 [Pseudaminobacter sp. 19-2017]|uniref:Uncharacterized protein n=1 Tax=Pseudaminobacter soli (ex Zhang et al. 2022) TaxID=2831468 RepID=A0A942E576_9HYPH|nr:hypothetical protein [Pseudaminobacter soli]MBS3651400.1 hypothetical protein [Pseudaminobacter soli]